MRLPICWWSTVIPFKDIELVAKPDKNFVLIMKDGKIYKDTQLAAH